MCVPVLVFWSFMCQVDNQLIGTTQPFMLYVTPLSNENEVIETGPAVQVNAVKFPSKSALTNIYKVGCCVCQHSWFLPQPRLPASILGPDRTWPAGPGGWVDRSMDRAHALHVGDLVPLPAMHGLLEE